MMKDFTRKEIESKMNTPGFYEGVKMVSEVFSFRSAEDLMKNWEYVKTYLLHYDTATLILTDDGVSVAKIRPFETDEDMEIAKFLMVSFFA